ncbi:MAG: GNAT family N-acetyltransferase [Acidimicrobiales bacterium]
MSCQPEVWIRPARDGDAAAMACLHQEGIGEGFLSTLGHSFLARLYRRVVRSPGGFGFVAGSNTEVEGFIAGTEAVGRLYREFLVRDGVMAVLGSLPELLRGWRRARETLSYGRKESGRHDLPAAELLAVAVSPALQGRGVGRRLVEEFVAELGCRGVNSAKVVVGADNGPALALYKKCGFRAAARRELHRGTASEVLVWP